MARRVLDTNVLIAFWLRKWGAEDRPRRMTAQVVQKWGRDLQEIHGSGTILTPIYLEFICGLASSREIELGRAYLMDFDVADKGRILAVDWEVAERIALRVPRDGLRRQLGDCLIRAICDRLGLELFTFERRFPRA